MGGTGEHSTVYEGLDGDVEIGIVWDSGHLEGSKVSGKVRRTPGGWSVMRERDAVGSIGRDGIAVDMPLRIDGGRVLCNDQVVARVDNPEHAAGALALVWLGRPDLYGGELPTPPAPTATAAPPAPPISATRPSAYPLVVLATVLVLCLLALAFATGLLPG